MKQQQQRLLAQENQFAKDKLTLGRVIGLPPGQDFNIAESVPFSPLTSITEEQALRTALDQRTDYQSYQAQVRAAEDSRQRRSRPALSHGPHHGRLWRRWTVACRIRTERSPSSPSAQFNIFDAGRISADVIQAKAALKQRQDELADLGGQIDYQVRTAFLDIRTASDQVAVAREQSRSGQRNPGAGARPIFRRRHRQYRGGAGAGIGGHGQR